AWIEPRDGGWCIGDAGGANGVYVNGERIEHWSTLSDGDEIQIGPALLTFSASSQLPRGLKLLSMQQAQTGADHSGCLITCACGTPAWVPAVLAGRQRPCVHCGQPLQEPPAMPEATCSICQCAIAAGETIHTCSDCGGTFHAACWQENFGCSSYGCPQVD